MVRLFQNANVEHTLDGIDPKRDVDVLETELMLADLESVTKQFDKVSGKARSGDTEAKDALELLNILKAGLEEGKPVRALGLDPESLKPFSMLTAKPVLYVGNTDEHTDPAVVDDFQALVQKLAAESVVLSGKLESELAELSGEDRELFMADLGMTHNGLKRVIVAAYKTLGLCSYFTGGPKESPGVDDPRGSQSPSSRRRDPLGL